MKFEFIEFYEATEETKAKKGKKCLGTVHIYAIDCELDIRGINVTKNGKAIFFHIPHFNDIDKDTGQRVRYPLIRFTNQQTHQEMMDFLNKNVKKEIKKRLNIQDREDLKTKSKE